MRAEADERREQRDPVGQLAAVGQKRDKHCAGERDQQDQRENRLIHRCHHSHCPIQLR